MTREQAIGKAFTLALEVRRAVVIHFDNGPEDAFHVMSVDEWIAPQTRLAPHTVTAEAVREETEDDVYLGNRHSRCRLTEFRYR